MIYYLFFQYIHRIQIELSSNGQLGRSVSNEMVIINRSRLVESTHSGIQSSQDYLVNGWVAKCHTSIIEIYLQLAIFTV